MKKLMCATAVAALCVAAGAVTTPAFAKNDAKMKKIGSALEYAYHKRQDVKAMAAAKKRGKVAKTYYKRAEDLPANLAKRSNELNIGRQTKGGFISIDAVAANRADDLAATMKAMGARKVASYGSTVSAEFPADRLADLDNSQYLAFARPVFVSTNAGLVTTQGDRSMRTDLVRAKLGFDGTGLTVGVLSDSFACDPGAGALAGGPYTTPAEDIANGDLPANVTILSDFTDLTACTDEGRAMAQLIHDVAPNASIAFYTAFNGEADFANGIVSLAKAGADVIVDDVIYFLEPMFQDGIIAQAADEVSRLGVPYYSSAGNNARNAFQSVLKFVSTPDGNFHNFGSGSNPDTKMTVTLDGGLQTNLVINWDQPNFSVSGAPGAQSNIDLVMFDSAGNRVPDCFVFLDANGFFPDLCQFRFTDNTGAEITGGNGGNAQEFVSLVDFVGGTTVDLGFELISGPAPHFLKFATTGSTFVNPEYPIDAGAGYGHNNAAGSEAVGASAFYFTEEFIGDPATDTLRAAAGEPDCVPACLNDFSSAGGTPVLFNTSGRRYFLPRIRLKPGVTGPDGGNTSFFFNDTSRDDDDGDGVFQTGEPGEFPNFFGTSAAAPHVAAVAALMIDAEDSQILTSTGDFRMCKPRGRHARRKRGRDLTVPSSAVDSQIANGALLGPCSRTEPDEIYWTIRATAQDMNVRASNSTGATVATFREIGRHGFDFDSGFGFVDAKRALRVFLKDMRRGNHGGHHKGRHDSDDRG